MAMCIPLGSTKRILIVNRKTITLIIIISKGFVGANDDAGGHNCTHDFYDEHDDDDDDAE